VSSKPTGCRSRPASRGDRPCSRYGRRSTRPDWTTDDRSTRSGLERPDLRRSGPSRFSPRACGPWPPRPSTASEPRRRCGRPACARSRRPRRSTDGRWRDPSIRRGRRACRIRRTSTPSEAWARPCSFPRRGLCRGSGCRRCADVDRSRGAFSYAGVAERTEPLDGGRRSRTGGAGPDATRGHPMTDAPCAVTRNPGGDLLSQGAAPQVPSARAVFTSVFGMGTGVSPPQLPPETWISKSEFRQRTAVL
jgi:hypothetical protein